MNPITISEDAFVAIFQPEPNHLNSHAPFAWNGGCGTLFETLGNEYEHVQKQEASLIWTLIVGDGCDFVASGFHVVNRLGYFITKLPVPDGLQVQVEFQKNANCSAKFPSPSEEITTAIHRLLEYLWEDERRHYRATDSANDRKSHIFREIQRVRRWVNQSHSMSHSRKGVNRVNHEENWKAQTSRKGSPSLLGRCNLRTNTLERNIK